MDLNNDLENYLAHAWCHHVRNDYIYNHLWSGESSVQASLATGLRKYLDKHSNVRVWFEVFRKVSFKKQTRKKIDLLVVMLPETFQETEIYEDFPEDKYSILLSCEMKFTSATSKGITNDINFLKYFKSVHPNSKHVFAWIPYTDLEYTEKRDEIINLTKEFSFYFLYGQPVKPFRWSCYYKGKEIHFNQEKP